MDVFMHAHMTVLMFKYVYMRHGGLVFSMLAANSEVLWFEFERSGIYD